MIKGIGVDIVDIDRFRGSMQRWGDRFVDRLFTQKEKEECMNRRDPARHLAVRFAAKEAFSKAVGTGLGGEISPRNIEVFSGKTGAPRLRLFDSAQQKVKALRATRAHVSLSHERGMGVAMVVLEGDAE